MANTALTPVEFHGASLFVTIIDNVPFVAIKSITEALGLDWQAQHARIMRHPVLSSTVSVTKTVAEDGKQREMLMLPLEKLNGWLFGVSVTRVKPELRTKLIQYQAECFDVLARHFGAVKPPVSVPDNTNHVQQAMRLASAAAAKVQQNLFDTIVAGNEPRKNQRWLVSATCYVDDVPFDAFIANWQQIVDSIGDRNGCMATNAELANLASVCNQRLAERMAVKTA